MTRELARRIAFTLGALFVYRLGLHIPLPGIDLQVWAAIFRPSANAPFGTSLFLSGASHRMAIFALGIVPYLTAAVLVQLATLVSKKLRALAQGGERGRRSIVRGTRYFTIVLAASQAWGIALALEDVRGVVANPGWLFIASTVITLTAGTLFLAWLAEQITLRGIGNGIAIVLVAADGLQLPGVVARIWELSRQGGSMKEVAGLLLIVVAVTALIVCLELARRRIPTRFTAQPGGPSLDERSSYLSVKLNPAGIIPVLLASWLIGILVALGYVAVARGLLDSRWLSALAQLTPGALPHLILSAVLIVFCTFFYTAFVLDPEATAERLKNLGGAIPAIEPGEATAAHIDSVISRTAVIGAAYIALVSLLPYFLARFVSVSFVVGGTPLLIVVCTMLDLDGQIRAVLHGREADGRS